MFWVHRIRNWLAVPRGRDISMFRPGVQRIARLLCGSSSPCAHHLDLAMAAFDIAEADVMADLKQRREKWEAHMADLENRRARPH
jgi:hypothetical protein